MSLRRVVGWTGCCALAVAALAAALSADNAYPPATTPLPKPIAPPPTASSRDAKPVPQPPQAAPPAVIEVKCPWEETSSGAVTLGSCEPPACPAGWADLGVASCAANGIWCGAGCAVVGECGRFCADR